MTLEKYHVPDQSTTAKKADGRSDEDNTGQHRSDGNLLPDRRAAQHGDLRPSGCIQRSWSDFRSQGDSDTGIGSGNRKGRITEFCSSNIRQDDSGEDRQTTRDYQKSITLDALRHALTDAQLEALLHRTYNPQEKVVVTVTDRATSKFAEDCFINQIPIKKARKSRRKTTPAQDHLEIYEEWNTSRNKEDCNASIVFGAYLSKYRDAFKEVDPQWAGNINIRSPIFNINKMVHDVAGGNFYKLVEFVETLIPLWAKAMSLNLDFPNVRPTFDTFFVRRGMWAQRFTTYKKWKNL